MSNPNIVDNTGTFSNVKAIDFEDFVVRNLNTDLSESIPNIEKHEDSMRNISCESEYFSAVSTTSDSVDFHSVGSAESSLTVESDPPICGIKQCKEKSLQDQRPKYFKCKLCDARFKTQLQLEWHNSPQHEQKLFTCTICKRDFESSANSYFMHHLIFHVEEWDEQLHDSQECV